MHQLCDVRSSDSQLPLSAKFIVCTNKPSARGSRAPKVVTSVRQAPKMRILLSSKNVAARNLPPACRGVTRPNDEAIGTRCPWAFTLDKARSFGTLHSLATLGAPSTRNTPSIPESWVRAHQHGAGEKGGKSGGLLDSRATPSRPKSKQLLLNDGNPKTKPVDFQTHQRPATRLNKEL
jgi:hypothetical protein